jgi:hypothetical protein
VEFRHYSTEFCHYSAKFCCYSQCCQLLNKLFGPANKKILPLAKKFGPTIKLVINTNITVFYKLYLLSKVRKTHRKQIWRVCFLKKSDFLYMNHNLQKSSAPFRPLFSKTKENSAANFSCRTDFYRAPFELCGRNFGPLATLVIPQTSVLLMCTGFNIHTVMISVAEPIIFMRLRVKILMQLRLLPYCIARQNFYKRTKV